ncbi:MAG: site-specific integrase [Deltaproteobacteria bacterium]|nr:site-specific integrase [Deltaproteobacteria bacterium]
MPPHLYRRKTSPNYYIKDGDRMISLKTHRKTFAGILLEEYTRKGLGIRTTPHKRLSQVLEKYLTEAKRVNKATTVDDKQRTVNFFIQQSGDPYLRQVNGDTIRSYLSWRQSRGVSNERLNTERQVLSNFFKTLVEDNPCKDVTKHKVVRSKGSKALSPKDEKRLMRWLLKNDKELYRMAIVVGNTGIRVRELANLIWADIDFKNQLLRITPKSDWTPKDYEERDIPLNIMALRALRKQRVSAVVTRYVFPRLDGKRYGRGLDLRMVRAFKEKKAGLGSGGFHTLRHTFASRAVESGMDLETLRKIMGHSDTKTLGRYLHVSEDHVRKAANRVKFGGAT